MFAYMTDICKVTEESTEDVVAEGDDLVSLLYHFLDEWLFVFSADPFFIPRVCLSLYYLLFVFLLDYHFVVYLFFFSESRYWNLIVSISESVVVVTVKPLIYLNILR